MRSRALLRRADVGAMPGKAGWDGLVDAVRLWNVALSWEDVRAHMNDTLDGAANPSMIGQWSCNEGAGAQMWDSSSRGNHGAYVWMQDVGCGM